MSNFFLLKFNDNNECVGTVHLTEHARLLQHLNDGYRMASQQEFEVEEEKLKNSHISEDVEETSEETQVPNIESAEDTFIDIGIKARESAKTNATWKPKHIWLLEKLAAEVESMQIKFANHEDPAEEDLTRAQAVRMAHELHLLAANVCSAIISKKPSKQPVQADYKEGDKITFNVLINGLDEHCRGKAGRKMVKILWDAIDNNESVNALEFVAKAYSHNGGSGNPFKPDTGYVARINAAWRAAGIPAAIDHSDLNNIVLRIMGV